MRRKRLILGRAVVLLIVGGVIGLTLFLARHLSPANLQRQVRDALGQVFSAEINMQVELALESGIKLRKLRVLYKDGEPAIEIERAVLYVDKERLLQGVVEIPQVDLYGLTVRLRPDPDLDGMPGLPGILRPPEGPMKRSELPIIRVRKGTEHSRIEITDAPFVQSQRRLDFRIKSFEGRQDGVPYIVYVELEEPNLGNISVTLSYDHAEDTIASRTQLHGVDLPTVLRLAGVDVLRSPAVDVQLEEGQATGLIEWTFALQSHDDDRFRAWADLSGIAGRIGDASRAPNLDALPRLKNGKAHLVLEEGMLLLHRFEADYESPRGERGLLRLALDEQGEPETGRIPLRDGAGRQRLHFVGKNITATTDDLRLLLAPESGPQILDRYNPAGTFDFDLLLGESPQGEAVLEAVLEFRDGYLRYDGRLLDPATGKREGFPYPLDRCRGKLEVRTNVPTEYGPARELIFTGIRGYHAIRDPAPDGPKDALFVMNGHITTYQFDPSEPETVDLTIVGRNLPIDQDLHAAFAKNVNGVPYEDFEFSGMATRVGVHILRSAHEDDTTYAHYDITLKDCSIAYKPFPIHVVRVSGNVREDTLPLDPQGKRLSRLVIKNMTGELQDGGTLEAHGVLLEQPDGTSEPDLHVTGHDLELGADLRRALRSTTGAGATVTRLWNQLRPSGRVYVEARIRDLSSPELNIDLGGQVRIAGYGDAECPIEKLRGRLMLQNGVFVLEDVSGELGSSSLSLKGEMDPNGASRMEASVRGLVFDPPVRDLMGALFPGDVAALGLLEPGAESRVDLDFKAQRATADEPMVYTATAQNLLLRLRIGDRRVVLRGGSVHFAQDRITLHDLDLREGKSWVRIEHGVLNLPWRRGGKLLLDARDLKPEGHLSQIFADSAREALGDEVRIDLEDFEISMRPASRRLVLAGGIDVRRIRLPRGGEPEAIEPTGAYELSPLTIALPEQPGDPVQFFGLIRFRGVRPRTTLELTDLSGLMFVAQGTVGDGGVYIRGAMRETSMLFRGRRIEQASLDLTVDKDYIRLDDIEARFYNGTLTGTVEANIADPFAYEVDVQLRDVDLGLLTRGDMPRTERISGVLDADLLLAAPSGDPRHLSGRGHISVRDGALLDVPLLRPLFAVLRRVTPIKSRPRFNKGIVEFTMTGEQIEITRLHLSSGVNDIKASGTISVYGDLDLQIKPQVTRIIDMPGLLQTPLFAWVGKLWNKAVYEIRLEGTLSNPELITRGLPFMARERRKYTESSHPLKAQRMGLGLLP